ncbi:MAG: PilZ domain-containing protein [Candidatus Aminicenantes bacterium]|nr:PilZ domain-containing protein [Candidatus Aminicenantes bacterium]
MSKPNLDALYKAPAKDQGFTFPLPTQVEGLDQAGRSFREETVLSFINHQGSTFRLKNQVAIGSKVKLIVDLPKKLAEGQNLKLVIKGRVVAIELDDRQNARKKVSIRFESRYIITPESSGQRP